MGRRIDSPEESITYTRNGTGLIEGPDGAIGLDYKTLYIAEKTGYGFGAIVSDNEIELLYLERSRQTITAIDKLYRIK